VRRLILVLPAAFSLALVLAAAALADNGLTPVQPVSPNAEAIRQTYWIILVVTGVIFVLVEGALLLFLVRFRGRGRARDQEGAQIHGASKLEVSFTLVPVLILFGIMAVVFVKLPSIKNVPAATAGTQNLKITVEGHQYYWQFTYPNGEISIEHMVVPLDRVVELKVVSSDVIHSWWVPALGGKIDAIPGVTNHTWFKAQKLGTYEARCAELCGLEHAHMIGFVDVVTPEHYRAFIAAHQGPGNVLGREIFEGVCATCHGFSGEGDYGPKIRGSSLLKDRQGLEDLLRDGKNRMPAVGSNWTDAEMKAALDYLGERVGGG